MFEPTRGLIAPPHTPFHEDGTIHFELIEKQAELFHRMGLVGVFVAGSTGEGQSLSTDERKKLAEHWVEVCRGSEMRVIIHAGHNGIEDVKELCRHASEIGADAVAVTAPSYFKPTSPEELIGFLAPAAAIAPDLPFYFYDIPMLTSVDGFAAAVLREGSDQIPNLRGLKYTNPDLVGLQDCVVAAGPEREVLFGCDDLLLASLMFGCRGAVGVTYNFSGPLYQSIIAAWEQRDFETARRRQYQSVQLIQILSRYGYLAASKAMMPLIGLDCGPTRPPLSTLMPDRSKQLRADLEAAELWSRDVFAF